MIEERIAAREALLAKGEKVKEPKNIYLEE